jgi:hypothetical protein
MQEKLPEASATKRTFVRSHDNGQRLVRCPLYVGAHHDQSFSGTSVAQGQLWTRVRINPVFSKLLYCYTPHPTHIQNITITVQRFASPRSSSERLNKNGQVYRTLFCVCGFGCSGRFIYGSRYCRSQQVRLFTSLRRRPMHDEFHLGELINRKQSALL